MFRLPRKLHGMFWNRHLKAFPPPFSVSPCGSHAGLSLALGMGPFFFFCNLKDTFHVHLNVLQNDAGSHECCESINILFRGCLISMERGGILPRISHSSITRRAELSRCLGSHAIPCWASKTSRLGPAPCVRPSEGGFSCCFDGGVTSLGGFPMGGREAESHGGCEAGRHLEGHNCSFILFGGPGVFY